VQETPINIDYSKFDKLAKIQAIAQKDNLIPEGQTFQRFVHLMRVEHLKTLMRAFENETDLKAQADAEEESKDKGQAGANKRRNGILQTDQETDSTNMDSIHMDCLKRIAGFFAISLSLHHNLPELFPKNSLVEMWDTAQISLQKSLEYLMNSMALDAVKKMI
jgi:hypothetical protein